MSEPVPKVAVFLGPLPALRAGVEMPGQGLGGRRREGPGQRMREANVPPGGSSWSSSFLPKIGRHFFPKHFPGPEETGIDRPRGDPENPGDFLIRKPFDVPEGQNHPVFRRERLQDPENLAPAAFFLLAFPDAGLGPVRDGQPDRRRPGRAKPSSAGTISANDP